MYVLDKKVHSLLLLMPLLISCAAKDVTGDAFAAKIVGKCFQATKDLVIYDVKGSDKDKVSSYSSSYLIVGDPSENQRFTKTGQPVGFVKNREMLLITKVIDFPYGSAGNCWVVKARHKNTKGKLLEIPSCWVWDQPIWIEPLSPIEQKNTDEELLIKAEQLKEVPRDNCSATASK